MASSQNGGGVPTAGHVNMMTDTIINNLPPNGLRTIMRSLISTNPSITKAFEQETKIYLGKAATTMRSTGMASTSLADAERVQKLVRCMIGCGLCISSLPLLGGLITQAINLDPAPGATHGDFFSSLDGDIVQAMTAVQKLLFVETGSRDLTDEETAAVQQLANALFEVQQTMSGTGREYPFGRGLLATTDVLGIEQSSSTIPSPFTNSSETFDHLSPALPKETFRLRKTTLPRIFSGLWQLSSPAWGTASSTKIVDQFSTYVQRGFTAFDMADHYGDAEIIFGHFLNEYPHRDAVFTATKYCVFHQMIISPDSVRKNISERCQRLQQAKIDLLQFHWQHYENPQYIDALRYIHQDERVRAIGLCNFDTKHMKHVLESGVPIYSNQVQFSLIDSRPTVTMGNICEQHNVKLLTYGTLCGGFLADKWLNKPEPDMYDESSTPSQRKYYEMICNWGDWALFQELLQTLHSIAHKHRVSISNAAVRWVLDFPYVGAIIIGARMGVSEHTEENLASLGWSLDAEDQSAIEGVLRRSKRQTMFERLGDCGAEYR